MTLHEFLRVGSMNALTCRQIILMDTGTLVTSTIINHNKTQQNMNYLNDMFGYDGTTLKRKCRHFDEIFITGCTGSCHFDNFQCSQWWKFHQNEDISVSVQVMKLSIFNSFEDGTDRLDLRCHLQMSCSNWTSICGTRVEVTGMAVVFLRCVACANILNQQIFM